MKTTLSWLSRHKFQAHLVAFGLMTLPAIALYFTAMAGADDWTWTLIGLVVAGNLLAVLTR